MNNSRLKKLWLEVNPLTSRSMSPTLILVYALMVIFFNSLNPLFLSLQNFKAISTSESVIAIVALGVGIVLISGNVDISVGATVGVVAVTIGQLIEFTDFPVPVLVLIGLAVGVTIGAINGFVVSYIGVNSIIVTLGMWALLRGVSLTIGQGTLYFRHESFSRMGRGYIFNVIPNVFFVMIVILILMYCILRWTKFGRNIYLVGANQLSANAVGVNVKRTKFLPFLISGGLAALGCILFISQIGSAWARYGTGGSLGGVGWEFRALTICIVGGLSISGGRGTYIGLFVAFLIIGSLTNGLTLISMPINWRDFFEGAILLFAIMLDSRRARSMEMII